MSLLGDPFDPTRDTALVTGAGNGMGRAIAHALVGEGVRTLFADRHADRLTAAIATHRVPSWRCLGSGTWHAVMSGMRCWPRREVHWGT